MALGAGERRVRPWWIALAVAAILATGAGAYALGRSGGEDLDQARADGRAAGERAGSARGAERGYAQGLKSGERQGYKSSYRKARSTLLKTGSGTPQAKAVTRSCGDLATEGAGSYGVSSVDVICDIALQVARQWENECASQPSGSCTVKAGFACAYSSTGYESGSISCTEGDRKVTFTTGA